MPGSQPDVRKIQRMGNMSPDIIHRILTLGQEMRDDIRPAEDEAGLGAKWDALMREVVADPSKVAPWEVDV